MTNEDVVDILHEKGMCGTLGLVHGDTTTHACILPTGHAGSCFDRPEIRTLEERVAFAERERDDALRARDNALQMRDEAVALKKAAGQSAARRIEDLVQLARSLATHGLVVERKDIERRLDEILK